jgi:hypothetical protein
MSFFSTNIARKGQGLVEYILVVFLMGVLGIVAIQRLSHSTQKGFTDASDRLDKELHD